MTHLNKRIHILFLEDNPADAELLLFTLEQEGYQCQWERVENRIDYQAAIRPGIDVILADYNLPQFTALEALRILQQMGLDIPFIVVTGSIEEVAIECMKEGAWDYLLKDRLARLAPAIEGALQEKRLHDEKRLAEESLRESESRFRLLAENATDMISRHSPEGHYIYVSPACKTILGYEPEEMLGLSTYDFMHPEDISAAIKAHAATLSEGVTPTVVYRLRAKDGHYVWLESVSQAIYEFETEELTEIQVASRDITQRKQMEDELQSSEERLRTVISKVPIVLFATDRHGNFTLSDGKGLEALGLRPGEVIGKSVFEVYKDIPNVIECIRRALAGEAFVALNQLGPICFETWYSPLRDSEGQLNGLIGVATDITERRKSELDLQKAHRDLYNAYDATIKGWSRALDYRDRETEGHTERVAGITLQLACDMGIPDEKLVHIQRGALLHDMGKMAIPDSILHKPGPLDAEEWAIMKKHPEYAVELLQPIEYLRPALTIPLYHHEKWNGTGYPYGLKGEDIPIEARIFAIVDVWDALAYDRIYREAWPHEKLLPYILEQSGIHFDPNVVDYFVRGIAPRL